MTETYKWFRCKFVNETSRLEIDLLCDANRYAMKYYRYFGLWDEENSTTLWPLLFNSDGSVDAGTEYGKDKDRYSEFTIHGKELIEYNTYIYVNLGAKIQPRLTEMIDLSAKTSRNA